MRGNLRKLGEGLKGISPSVYAVMRAFSGLYVLGLEEFSRLPDSATLAPLRMVELSAL
jgi:hypothetical protein